MPPRDSDSPDDPIPTDVETGDGDATRPERLLAAVQDAAIERALLDDGDAVRHLALAGGLERARRVAAEGDTSGRSGPFGPALLAVATLAAFDAREGDASDPGAGGPVPAGPAQPPASPWRPASADGATEASSTGDRRTDRPDEAAVEGAALAVRRFDADVRRAAALADVPVATLSRRVESVTD